MPTTISAIYRYPIKGLSAESLASIPLTVGREIPGDRQFALALSTTGFDRDDPAWLPKTNFLNLAQIEKLAALRTEFDCQTATLKILADGGEVMSTNVSLAAGCRKLEGFFAEYLSEQLDGPPKMVEAAGHSFSDHRHKVLSLINQRSIGSLESYLGSTLDPIRFRGNIYFEGEAAWREFDWIDRYIEVGEAVLEVTQAIDRCAATNVNPRSAMRDLNIPKSLTLAYGHVDMGIYARVVESGAIKIGDRLNVI